MNNNGNKRFFYTLAFVSMLISSSIYSLVVFPSISIENNTDFEIQVSFTLGATKSGNTPARATVKPPIPVRGPSSEAFNCKNVGEARSLIIKAKSQTSTDLGRCGVNNLKITSSNATLFEATEPIYFNILVRDKGIKINKENSRFKVDINVGSTGKKN